MSDNEIEIMIDEFKKSEISRLNSIYIEHPNPIDIYQWHDFEENTKIFKEYIYNNDYTKIDSIIKIYI